MKKLILALGLAVGALSLSGCTVYTRPAEPVYLEGAPYGTVRVWEPGYGWVVYRTYYHHYHGCYGYVDRWGRFHCR